ncbi:MAG: hypothetical protein ABR532_02540 [Candidatus Dormibacteria bacterium]
MPRKPVSRSRIPSTQQALDILVQLLAEESPKRAERLREAGLMPEPGEELDAVVRLTAPALALVEESAAEAVARGEERISRQRCRGEGIVWALRRLDSEQPPELAPGSLRDRPGGESPAPKTYAAMVPLRVKHRLDILRPAATAAWDRQRRGHFGGGPRVKATDSMVVQYVIERLRAARKGER